MLGVKGEKGSSEKQTLVDIDTGEIKEENINSEPEKDRNFYKVFPQFFRTLDHIANQKVRLLIWIIRNLKGLNRLSSSYRHMAKATNISYATVAETMRELQKRDFLRKHNAGYYIINPNIIFKGTRQRRSAACVEFNELKRGINATEEKLLADINKKIMRLQKEANVLIHNMGMDEIYKKY